VVRKIISGGQTRADRGGLLAGELLGIETGGTAPPGFMTEIGPDLSLKKLGLVEGEPDPKIFPKRTRKNVEDSDGTLLMGNIDSPGSKLTLRYCNELDKPRIINPTPSGLRWWLTAYKIEILNVAGNRESKNPAELEIEGLERFKTRIKEIRRSNIERRYGDE